MRHRPDPLAPVGLLLVLVLTACMATAADHAGPGERQAHVINSFKPPAARPGAAAGAAADIAHRVDAQPSDPVDGDGEGEAVVPGYGLNGGHGDVTPWLPSSPTWQLPQVQPTYQVQQVQPSQQVQQVQQEVQVQQDMMRVIHRPGTGPTPSAHYIVNRPADRIDTVVEPSKPSKPPSKPSRPAGAAGGAVSETDMYLLGAIEKLVYRVDFLEKRLRRTEELVYYLMEGAGSKQDAAEPCPKDFTRAGKHCYHFSGRDLNWKSSSSACKAMDSILVELVSPEDKRDLVNWISAHQEFRGRDFWTGGLNPGLLWIWANSARPVASSGHNSTSSNAIKNPGGEDIPGNGRCLKLAYNPATRLYNYLGGDCSARFRFICQLEEPSASRALSRIHKSLNIRLDGDSNPPPSPSEPAAP